MSGALKAGSVYVAVSAAIGDFTKQMADVLKTVEKTAARVKAAAEPIGAIGRAIAVGMAGVVYAAAKSNQAVGAHVDKLSATFARLSGDVARMLLPVLDALQRVVAKVTYVFEHMSAGHKRAAATALEVAAVVGLVATVVGRLAGLVSGLSAVLGMLVSAGSAVVGALSSVSLGAGAVAAAEAAATVASAGLLASLGAVAMAALPWIAVAGAVVLALGALYKAWETNAGHIRTSVLAAWGVVVKATQELAAGVVSAGSSFVDGVSEMFKGALQLAGEFGDGLWAVFEAIKKALLQWVREQAKSLSGLFSMVGINTAPMLEKVEEALTAVDKYASRATVNAALDMGVAYAKGLGQGISKSVKYAVDGTKMLAGDVWDAAKGAWEQVKGKLSDMVGGETVHVKVKVDFTVGEELNTARIKDVIAKEREAQAFGMAHGGQRAVMADDLRAALRQVLAEPLAAVPGAARTDAANEERAAGDKRISTILAGLYDSLAQDVNVAVDKARSAIPNAVRDFTDKLLGSLGQAGSLIQDGLKAAAEGGPAAAIVTVVGDLLMQSTQFQHLVEVLNGIVGMVADTVGKLAEPFIPLLGAVSMLVKAGLDALAPAFSAISAMIQPLVPPLVVLGELFQALAPVLALVVSVMTLIINPLQLFAGPVMHALFDVLKLVSRVILTVVKAVAGVWNGVVGAIQSVLRTIGNLSILGKKPLGFLSGWADGLNSAIISTDGMTAALQSLSGLTWDQAQAAAAQTAESVRNREALARANEELSNVPNAFKTALRRFQAQDAQTGFTGSGGVSVPVATQPPAAPYVPGSSFTPMPGGPRIAGNGGYYGNIAGAYAAAAAPTLHLTTTINTTNPAESMAQYERLVDKVAYKLTGSRGRAGRWAVPEGA
ncbi:MAG: hypothetical protein ACJ8AT_06160 [Hyalangium sp.]|uniref:hypothetical protein n=1 Tax=Hyalangium sp. TaxID=2028555 RepID=UPI00389A3A0B